MKRNLHLLVIDPQNDFCDLPDAYRPPNPVTGRPYTPALPVKGAHSDMLRVADIINCAGAGLSGISITLDTHHRLDIAHPTFWKTAHGDPVTPFTQITAADVHSGRFRPYTSEVVPRVLTYLDALEATQRYRHTIWPVHCELGSWGHTIHADVIAAYQTWEDSTQLSVNLVSKGLNPWTEHYSAIKAEVPDLDDAETQLNSRLIALLAAADQVYITGEAASHCVKATTEHIVEQFGAANLNKIVLVSDCMSPVIGFETQSGDFIRDMMARGVQIATAADVQAVLLNNINN